MSPVHALVKQTSRSANLRRDVLSGLRARTEMSEVSDRRWNREPRRIALPKRRSSYCALPTVHGKIEPASHPGGAQPSGLSEISPLSRWSGESAASDGSGISGIARRIQL